jgi:hypothetical protein
MECFLAMFRKNRLRSIDWRINSLSDNMCKTNTILIYHEIYHYTVFKGGLMCDGEI